MLATACGIQRLPAGFPSEKKASNSWQHTGKTKFRGNFLECEHQKDGLKCRKLVEKQTIF
jgi:hypothetical protein